MYETSTLLLEYYSLEIEYLSILLSTGSKDYYNYLDFNHHIILQKLEYLMHIYKLMHSYHILDKITTMHYAFISSYVHHHRSKIVLSSKY